MKTRPFALGLCLGACHFLVSAAIVPFTLWMGTTALSIPLKDPLLKILHMATEIFYFPIVSLALYPRHWFPGPWIYAPIVFNSLVWGLGIAGFFLLLRKFRN